MAVSKQRFKQAEALRSVVLRMVQWAPEGPAQDIRRIAERPLDDWTDGDIESMTAWIVEHGEEAVDGKIQREVELVLAVVETLSPSDSLYREAEHFFTTAFSAGARHETPAAPEDLDHLDWGHLVEEAKKRLA
jgi:hypothetical protein